GHVPAPPVSDPDNPGIANRKHIARSAADYHISPLRAGLTAFFSILTAGIFLLLERIHKYLSSKAKEDAVAEVVTQIHRQLASNPNVETLSVTINNNDTLEISNTLEGGEAGLSLKFGSEAKGIRIPGMTFPKLVEELTAEITSPENQGIEK